MRARLDWLAKTVARRLLSWAARSAEPSQREWLEAAQAELDEIEGGGARLAWAVSGLRLVWWGRRSLVVRMVERYSVLALDLLAAALLITLTVNLAQRYALLGVHLLS